MGRSGNVPEQSNRQQQKARLYGGFSTSNGSATGGTSTTLSTLISRNGAGSDKFRRDVLQKKTFTEEQTKEAGEIFKRIEEDDYKQF